MAGVANQGSEPTDSVVDGADDAFDIVDTSEGFLNVIKSNQRGEPMSEEIDGPYVVRTGENEPGTQWLGGIIEFLRCLNHMTRQELAEQVNVSVEFIRLIELGRRAPALNLAKDIWEAFPNQPGYTLYQMGPYDLVVRDPRSDKLIGFSFTSRIKSRRHTQIDNLDKRQRDLGLKIEIRKEALTLALQYCFEMSQEPKPTDETVIKWAKTFEAFLKGE